MNAATPFFYLIVEDNITSALATTPPPWGRPLQGLPDAGGFHMSDWHDLAHVLTWRLAHHPARTLDATGSARIRTSTARELSVSTNRQNGDPREGLRTLVATSSGRVPRATSSHIMRRPPPEGVRVLECTARLQRASC